MRERDAVATQRRMAMQRQIMADVYEWEIETQRALPMTAYRIADIEMVGGVVDLETAEVFYPKEKASDPVFEL